MAAFGLWWKESDAGDESGRGFELALKKHSERRVVSELRVGVRELDGTTFFPVHFGLSADVLRHPHFTLAPYVSGGPFLAGLRALSGNEFEGFHPNCEDCCVTPP